MNHHPVGAEIDPVAVALAQDRHRAGADIAPAIVVMPQRRGEFEQVDPIPFIDVLKDRSILDRHRWKLVELIAPAAHFVLHAADQVQAFNAKRHLQGQRQALGARHRSDEQTKSRGIVLDVVEQQRRPARLGVELDHGADLFVPVGAVDSLDLAVRFDGV